MLCFHAVGVFLRVVDWFCASRLEFEGDFSMYGTGSAEHDSSISTREFQSRLLVLLMRFG